MPEASLPSPAPRPARWVVAALYQFRPLDDPAGLRAELQSLAARLGLCGTLIVAPEGINGTVAGSRAATDELHAFLLAAGFDRLEYKESPSENQPFKRLKVRLKREIVTMGVPVQPLSQAGEYLTPAEWNALLDDPGVVVVDTRNRYEVQAGTFRGAVNPGLASFREFPAWAEAHREDLAGKRIAMFCTGGIRCERSTSLLRALGYQDVFHLRGGILRYLEEVPEAQSRWQGECFVFDGRVTVGHGLTPGQSEGCHSCGWPLTPEDTRHPHFERGVSCPHCFSNTTAAQKAGFRERQRQYGARG